MQGQTIGRQELDYGGTRQHRRYDLGVQVAVQLVGSDTTLPGRSFDISLGGMAIVLAKDLPVGAVVELHFAIPGSARLSPRAVVRQREGHRYGLQFIALSAAERTAIEKACSWLAVL